MNRKYWQATIIDIQNTGCNEAEQELLLEYFESTMKSTTQSLIRKAYFELEDFHGAKERGLASFSLLMERGHRNEELEQWKGIYQSGNKKLEILGQLERV
jgi:hypothetical protein